MLDEDVANKYQMVKQIVHKRKHVAFEKQVI